MDEILIREFGIESYKLYRAHFIEMQEVVERERRIVDRIYRFEGFRFYICMKPFVERRLIKVELSIYNSKDKLLYKYVCDIRDTLFMDKDDFKEEMIQTVIAFEVWFYGTMYKGRMEVSANNEDDEFYDVSVMLDGSLILDSVPIKSEYVKDGEKCRDFYTRLVRGYELIMNKRRDYMNGGKGNE